MWRKYWQWIFVSCLSPPPPRLAMSVYSDCLDVNNKTSAQKRENGKICKRAASKNFPMQWISKRHTTPILLLTRAVQIWFWVQSSSFRNRLVFSVCFPITRGNLFLHLSLVNNGERAKLLIAIHTLRFLTFALRSSSSLSSPIPSLSSLLPSPVPSIPSLLPSPVSYLSSLFLAPPQFPSPSGLYGT